MDREAWHAMVLGVSKSQTWLSNWAELSWTEGHPGTLLRCADPSSGTNCAGSQRTSLVDWRKVNKLLSPSDGHTGHYLAGAIPWPQQLCSVFGSGDLLHQCIETPEPIYSSRSHLPDELLYSPGFEWFTDRTNCVEIRTRQARYGTVSLDEVMETKAVPHPRH